MLNMHYSICRAPNYDGTERQTRCLFCPLILDYSDSCPGCYVESMSILLFLRAVHRSHGCLSFATFRAYLNKLKDCATSKLHRGEARSAKNWWDMVDRKRFLTGEWRRMALRTIEAVIIPTLYMWSHFVLNVLIAKSNSCTFHQRLCSHVVVNHFPPFRWQGVLGWLANSFSVFRG